jgi:hypothetical protein
MELILIIVVVVLLFGGAAVVPQCPPSSMHYRNVTPSHLPSFLLPCPQCRHKDAITTVAPAPYANGAAPNDLEDGTHTCGQCCTTRIRTRRPFSSDTPATAHRI